MEASPPLIRSAADKFGTRLPIPISIFARVTTVWRMHMMPWNDLVQESGALYVI
jgi:hypothetical protein